MAPCRVLARDGARIESDTPLAERPPAEEEGTRKAADGRTHAAPEWPADPLGMTLVSAIHLYVTDLDRAIDFYSRLLGRGPQAAYDEGPTAHSAFFALEERAHLVLTWDPERGREVGGSVRLELAAEDLEREIDRLLERGVQGGRLTRTRFGTEVYDLTDPDGHLIRLGPAWTLHAIEGAV